MNDLQSKLNAILSKASDHATSEAEATNAVVKAVKMLRTMNECGDTDIVLRALTREEIKEKSDDSNDNLEDAIVEGAASFLKKYLKGSKK